MEKPYKVKVKNKIKTVLIILLLFIIIYFLQINFFSWFNIAGIMPNLFVLLVLFIGLFVGKSMGILFGILFGIILDALFGRAVGISAALLAIIGFLGELFDRNFSKDSRITIIAMSLFSTTIYEIGIYLVNIFAYGASAEIPAFIYNIIIENIFNIFIIIIFYSGIRKLGYYLENCFYEKEFQTRYF